MYTYQVFFYRIIIILTQSGVFDKSKYFVNPFVNVSLSAGILVCCSSIIGGVSLIQMLLGILSNYKQ